MMSPIDFLGKGTIITSWRQSKRMPEKGEYGRNDTDGVLVMIAQAKEVTCLRSHSPKSLLETSSR